MKEDCEHCQFNAGPTTGQIEFYSRKDAPPRILTWCRQIIDPLKKFQKGYVLRTSKCKDFKPKN